MNRGDAKARRKQTKMSSEAVRKGKGKVKSGSTSADAVDVERTACAEPGPDTEPYCDFSEQSVRMLCKSQLSNEEIAAKCDRSVEELESIYGERLNKWRTAGIGHGKLLLFPAACKRSVTAIALFLKSHAGLGKTVEETPENSTANYKAQLRNMSDAELTEEIERQEIACGSYTQEKVAAGASGSEPPPN